MNGDCGKYVAYLRKSRADADAERRGEGETLARHETALRELAQRRKLNLTDVYREIVSGDTIAARPVMRRLLAEVEAGRWTGVLVMEVERLARGDTIDQGVVAEAFRLSGTEIVTPSKTYRPGDESDEEYFEFGLFMSRREYKAINRRLQRGRAASVREGKYVGSVPPYGYDRKKLEREKGYILVPNPEQAAVVRLIFTLYASGERKPDGASERVGIAGIARRLDALRIPPPRGDAWAAASVREMLRNPVYAGRLRWNWRMERKRRKNGKVTVSRPRSSETLFLSEGRHEALIAPEVFDAAQRRLAEKSAPSVREAGALRNPLAGLVICGKCGRRMQRRPYKNGLPAALICPNPACDNVSADLSAVEARILSGLRPWLEGRRLSGTAEASDADAVREARRQSLARLGREIAALERRREHLCDLVECGIYDAVTYRERGAVIAERLERARRDKAALDAVESEEKAREEARLAAEDTEILDAYAALTPSGKNGLLKAVLEKAVYRKEARERWSRPDAFVLDLFPKIPRTGR